MPQAETNRPLPQSTSPCSIFASFASRHKATEACLLQWYEISRWLRRTEEPGCHGMLVIDGLTECRQDDTLLKQGVVSRRLQVPESITRPSYVQLQESPWGDDLQIHNTKVQSDGEETSSCCLGSTAGMCSINHIRQLDRQPQVVGCLDRVAILAGRVMA